MLSPQQATSRINVKRLMLAETGKYDLQVSRPYQTNLQGNTLNLLIDRVGGSTRFTGSQLAGIASQIVSPSAQYENGVNIAGVPWNERRMRFMMEVECRALAGGASTTVMVLGYTNYPGVIAHTGAVDPRMEFYVNSVISVRATPEHTPTGVRMHTAITDNSHVLVNQSYAGAYGNTQAYKMRPEDVYAAMKLTAITPIQDVLDIRTIMDTKPIASKRSNTIATDYAAGLLDGYSRASLDQNLGVHKEEDILECARGYAQESLVQNNPFFRAIQNYHEGFMANFFTWTDLNKLDPNVDNVTVITMLGQTTAASNPLQAYDVASGTAAPWTGSDRDTHVATILSQSVPALMTEFGLTTIGFVSTNRRVFADAVEGSGPFSAASRLNTRITDMLSFADFDMAPYMPHFVSRLEQLVMMDISYNNEMDFYVDMHADLIGESWIKISLDGKPITLYVTPSFADALMVPVVTSEAGRASQLSKDFEAIFHQVANHAGMGYNIGGPGAVQQPQMTAPENLFGRI